jgi:hypothetical protein
LTKFWGSADLRLKIDEDSYYVYLAPNVTAVKEMHEAHHVSKVNH